jgi:hypothetical protein
MSRGSNSKWWKASNRHYVAPTVAPSSWKYILGYSIVDVIGMRLRKLQVFFKQLDFELVGLTPRILRLFVIELITTKWSPH